MRAAYNRTFDIPKKGLAHNAQEKAPENVAMTMISLEDKKAWYLVWLENEKSWVKAKCTELWRKTTRETEIGLEAWLTESQL